MHGVASYAEQVKSLSEKGGRTLLTIKEFPMELNFFYLGYKVMQVFALRIRTRALLSRKYLALIIMLSSHAFGI